MKEKFDTLLDRTGTESVKWDLRGERFGKEDVLPLWIADMDFECAEPIVHALKKRVKHKNYGYTFYPSEFYDVIETWMETQHNWEIQEDWIQPTPGVTPALKLAIREFSNPGDKVIVQPPVYYPFYDAVRKNGRQLVLNELVLEDGTYRMNFEQLENQLEDPRTRMFILCSPHNPVGRVWTEEELTKLGNLCIENNVLVIADEIHSDIVFEDYTHIPFASISQEFAKHSITCNAPTKTFNLSGLHTSYTIIPDTVKFNRFSNMVENIGLGINLFGIKALIAAYEKGTPWYTQLMEYLEENRDFTLDYVGEQIPGIQPIQPEGTFLVWLDCRELGLDSRELHQFMINEANVGLVNGATFNPGGDGFLRLCIGCPRDFLKKALQNIKQAVQDIL